MAGKTEIVTAREHTCRDEGYSPYTKACPVCVTMLWNRCVAPAAKSRRRADRPMTTNQMVALFAQVCS